MKKTLVLGASPNPKRISYAAVELLSDKGFDVVPVGNREGKIDGIDIQRNSPAVEEVDTITLYLNPTRQQEYYAYILGLQPRRIIFNPGTENPELIQLAKEAGIEVIVACTLVMLSVGNY